MSITGVDRLLDLLRNHGCDVVFGVPGDTNVGLYGGFARSDAPPIHVMARDERSAGFMADAYARVSGRPGVVEVPSGAGPMYALPAVAEAERSAVPLVMLTFETALQAERRGLISEMDCAAVVRPVAKDSWQLKSPNLLGDAMRRAFRLARGPRPGATHLAIPEDLLHSDSGTDTQADPVAASACAPSPDAIDALAHMLRFAQKPVLLAGGGVNRARAQDALKACTEVWNLPVVTSLTGQGALDDRHPLNFGVVGDNGYHPHAIEAVNASDLLICVGTALGSTLTIGQRFPEPSTTRKLVHVDIDTRILGQTYPADLTINADAACFLAMMAAQTTTSDFAAWVRDLTAARSATFDADEGVLTSNATPLWPERVMNALQPFVTGPTTLVLDPGTPTPYAARYLRLGPGSHYVIPRGFGGLGYAIPGVVGAWMANRDATLVGMFGDGSMGMSAGELETLARLNVPARLIHFSNGTFGLIKSIQRQTADNAVASVDFTRLDAAAIARAHGLAAWHVETGAELDIALKQAFQHDGPSFVDVVVEDISEVLAPMFNLTRRTGTDPLLRDRTNRRPVRAPKVAQHLPE